MPEIPKIRAIKIIKEGGEELRKLIPINNSQKGKNIYPSIKFRRY